MKNQSWPKVLMILGFIVALISLAALTLGHLTTSTTVLASVAEGLGVGIASIGIGGHITRSRRGN